MGPIGSSIQMMTKVYSGLPAHYSLYVSMDIILHSEWAGEKLAVVVGGNTAYEAHPT